MNPFIIWAARREQKRFDASLQGQAKRLGIPFEDRDFWPPYELHREPRRYYCRNKSVCPDLYSAKKGDVVPVFTTDGSDHFYTVLGFSRASGDDHIVSPAQFHIRYHHSDRLAPTQGKDEG